MEKKPTIFLLKTSPHNEEFLYDDGYATTNEELEAIAKNYVAIYYYANPKSLTSKVDLVKNTLTVTHEDGMSKTFYIVEINPSKLT